MGINNGDNNDNIDDDNNINGDVGKEQGSIIRIHN